MFKSKGWYFKIFQVFESKVLGEVCEYREVYTLRKKYRYLNMWQGTPFKHIGNDAGVGVLLVPRDLDFCDKLYGYYHSLDRTVFNSHCNSEFERVMREYAIGK